MHKNCEDLTGKIFSNWTVLKLDPKKHNRIQWICRCLCGIEESVIATNLKRNLSKGCMKCAAIRRTTHNMSNSSTYSIYIQMIERCHNQDHKYYHWYGERGIRVCERWLKSFQNFLEDMGVKPENLSIDRIDNDQGYSKENCRWTTKKEQQNNRQNSIRIGEISGTWIVVFRIENEKKYIIRCLSCERERIVLSCNFRRLHKCKCSEE